MAKSKKIFRPIKKLSKASSGLAHILPMRNDFNIIENIDENFHEDIEDESIVPALGADPIPGNE